MLTDFALENVKLIMLFVLIGTLIGLSHLNAENLAKSKSALIRAIWRGIGRISKTAVAAN